MKQIVTNSQKNRSNIFLKQSTVRYLARGAVLFSSLGFVFASGIPNVNSAPKRTATPRHPNGQRQEGFTRPRFATTFPTPTPEPTPEPTPAQCQAW